MNAPLPELESLLSQAGPGTARAALRLLTAQILALPEADRPGRLQSGLATLEARLPAGSMAHEVLALGEAHLAAGGRMQAMELYSRAYRLNLADLELAHRLGLLFLTRAQGTAPADRAQTLERWQRALAYLGAALWDRDHWQSWTTARSRTYGESLTEEHRREAQRRILVQVRTLLAARAEETEKTHPATGAALRGLLVGLEVDQSAVAVFRRALDCVRIEGKSMPLPFAPGWLRTLESPLTARKLLGEIVGRTETVPAGGDDAPEEPAADTLGQALRQCYSRLAPVRYALLQGQAEPARRALEGVCPAEEGCRPSSGPRRVAGSPATCDPGCERFGLCNPGYAELPDPEKALSYDAHRLAIRTSLALAGQHVAARPPQMFLATQEWLRARSLAEAIGHSDRLHEELLAQIMGFLDNLAGHSEDAAALLQGALTALPTDALRGRLTDRLTERGIIRANADQLEESVLDLRAAVGLNRHSVRARHNLCLVLQALTTHQHNRGQREPACESARELVDQARQALKQGLDESTLGPILQWAEQYLATWGGGRDPLDILDQLTGDGSETNP